MIIENGINHQEELKEVLICYLRFNTDEYHVDMNINMFQQNSHISLYINVCLCVESDV
ncbi:hypothetical protein YC2023_054315 [Brassica napus]